ncbi:MAG TPA: hypothetical protein VGD05_07875 [Pyrinomonadaceae bacterium]
MMEATKFNKYILGRSFAFSGIFLKISPCLWFCGLILLLTFPSHAQNLPDKIRGYKVYNAKISVRTERDKTEIKDKKDKSEASVKMSEPELADVSLTGITFEITAEISIYEQSGKVDFLTFHNFTVNELPVEIEEYKESFPLRKNHPTRLPKPFKIFLGTTQALRGASKELKNSKDEWQVTGRVFVFGRFKKFGFSFKRVIPVEINIKIKNPLQQAKNFLKT